VRIRVHVKWESAVMSFEEVVGLALDTQAARTAGTVLMKKGVFKSDQKFWEWFNQFKTSATRRVPITVSLMDEAGRPIRAWTLTNAWPAKVTGPDLKATGNEVAIDTIEIAHEGLTVTSA